MAANFDFEQAGELKIGQVGIANLRVRTLDPQRLGEEMAERVRRAPKLFERAAVVVDFGGLSQCPAEDSARALITALRQAGVLPVALAYGTSDIQALAERLELPLLAKFRAQYERAGDAVPAPASAQPEPAPARAPTAAPASGDACGMVHTQPVRSGQQVYAQGRDLVLTAQVGAGAEVIADGSIHIYAPLRGRALAGAQGDARARIFCREFHGELLAIAGHYKVFEDLPAALRGKPVQAWLDGGTLRVEELN
ncbi:MAG: septum site-determining protein MinC [Lysobacteraceae bacterium]